MVKSKKIAWEVLLFAKPFRNFVPECGPRDSESNGGFLYSMPESLERFRQTRTPRQSSSDLKFIAERQKLCKGNQECHLLALTTAVPGHDLSYSLLAGCAVALLPKLMTYCPESGILERR